VFLGRAGEEKTPAKRIRPDFSIEGGKAKRETGRAGPGGNRLYSGGGEKAGQ